VINNILSAPPARKQAGAGLVNAIVELVRPGAKPAFSAKKNSREKGTGRLTPFPYLAEGEKRWTHE
jgi:hypothetical protein